MEIGKPDNLDDPSLIEYFIEGIPDSRADKSNLYHTYTIPYLYIERANKGISGVKFYFCEFCSKSFYLTAEKFIPLESD